MRSEIEQSEHKTLIVSKLKGKVGRTPTYARIQKEIEDETGERYSIRQLRWYRAKRIRPDQILDSVETRKVLQQKAQEIDVLVERVRLYFMQMQRLKTGRELEAAGLLLEIVGDETERANRMLDSIKKDMQDMGMMGKVADVEILFRTATQAVIGAVLDEEDVVRDRIIARLEAAVEDDTDRAEEGPEKKRVRKKSLVIR